MSPGVQLKGTATGESDTTNMAQVGMNLGQVLLCVGNQLMLSSKPEWTAGAKEGRGVLADVSSALGCCG